MLFPIQERDASIHQLGRKASLSGRRLGESIDEVGPYVRRVRLERVGEFGEESHLLGASGLAGLEGFAPKSVQSLDLFGVHTDRLDDFLSLPPLDYSAPRRGPALRRSVGRCSFAGHFGLEWTPK